MSSSGHRIMCIYRLRPALNYGLCDKAMYTNSMYSVGDGTHTKPCAHHLLQRLLDVQLQGDATSVRPACDAVYVARASKKHCWSIQVGLSISCIDILYCDSSIFQILRAVNICSWVESFNLSHEILVPLNRGIIKNKNVWTSWWSLLPLTLSI